MSRIPDGWKLVPVEATAAMLESGDDCFDGCSYPDEDGLLCKTAAKHIWKDMLSAAPSPPEDTEARELAGKLRVMADNLASPTLSIQLGADCYSYVSDIRAAAQMLDDPEK